ncbi:reverse transcriptase domain-containing protein, partial [Tanacetum coccineum]
MVTYEGIRDNPAKTKIIAEMQSPNTWGQMQSLLDEASNAKGSGAGLVLTSPTKMEYTYALRLNFDSTNNQAEYEYEAKLAGLRIAKKMRVVSLLV